MNSLLFQPLNFVPSEPVLVAQPAGLIQLKTEDVSLSSVQVCEKATSAVSLSGSSQEVISIEECDLELKKIILEKSQNISDRYEILPNRNVKKGRRPVWKKDKKPSQVVSNLPPQLVQLAEEIQDNPFSRAGSLQIKNQDVSTNSDVLDASQILLNKLHGVTVVVPYTRPIGVRTLNDIKRIFESYEYAFQRQGFKLRNSAKEKAYVEYAYYKFAFTGVFPHVMQAVRAFKLVNSVKQLEFEKRGGYLERLSYLKKIKKVITFKNVFGDMFIKRIPEFSFSRKVLPETQGSGVSRNPQWQPVAPSPPAIPVQPRTISQIFVDSYQSIKNAIFNIPNMFKKFSMYSLMVGRYVGSPIRRVGGILQWFDPRQQVKLAYAAAKSEITGEMRHFLKEMTTSAFDQLKDLFYDLFGKIRDKLKWLGNMALNVGMFILLLVGACLMGLAISAGVWWIIYLLLKAFAYIYITMFGAKEDESTLLQIFNLWIGELEKMFGIYKKPHTQNGPAVGGFITTLAYYALFREMPGNTVRELSGLRSLLAVSESAFKSIEYVFNKIPEWLKTLSCWYNNIPTEAEKLEQTYLNFMNQADNILKMTLSEFDHKAGEDKEFALKTIRLVNSFQAMRDVILRDNAFSQSQKQAFSLAYVKLREFHGRAMKAKSLHSSRMPPVFLWMVAGTGVGKSFALDLIGSALYAELVERGIEEGRYNAAMRFERKAGVEFWDFYHDQWMCTWDDGFQSLILEDRNMIATELIYAANTNVFPLNMADLSDKGLATFSSKFMVVTTNDVSPQKQLGIACPDALMRRRDFVVSVKRTRNDFGEDTAECFKNYDFYIHNKIGDLGTGQHIQFFDLIMKMADLYQKRMTNRQQFVKSLEEFDWKRYKTWRSVPSEITNTPTNSNFDDNLVSKSKARKAVPQRVYKPKSMASKVDTESKPSPSPVPETQMDPKGVVTSKVVVEKSEDSEEGEDENEQEGEVDGDQEEEGEDEGYESGAGVFDSDDEPFEVEPKRPKYIPVLAEAVPSPHIPLAPEVIAELPQVEPLQVELQEVLVAPRILNRDRTDEPTAEFFPGSPSYDYDFEVKEMSSYESEIDQFSISEAQMARINRHPEMYREAFTSAVANPGVISITRTGNLRYQEKMARFFVRHSKYLSWPFNFWKVSHWMERFSQIHVRPLCITLRDAKKLHQMFSFDAPFEDDSLSEFMKNIDTMSICPITKKDKDPCQYMFNGKLKICSPDEITEVASKKLFYFVNNKNYIVFEVHRMMGPDGNIFHLVDNMCRSVVDEELTSINTRYQPQQLIVEIAPRMWVPANDALDRLIAIDMGKLTPKYLYFEKWDSVSENILHQFVMDHYDLLRSRYGMPNHVFPFSATRGRPIHEEIDIDEPLLFHYPTGDVSISRSRIGYKIESDKMYLTFHAHGIDVEIEIPRISNSPYATLKQLKERVIRHASFRHLLAHLDPNNAAQVYDAITMFQRDCLDSFFEMDFMKNFYFFSTSFLPKVHMDVFGLRTLNKVIVDRYAIATVFLGGAAGLATLGLMAAGLVYLVKGAWYMLKGTFGIGETQSNPEYERKIKKAAKKKARDMSNTRKVTYMGAHTQNLTDSDHDVIHQFLRCNYKIYIIGQKYRSNTQVQFLRGHVGVIPLHTIRCIDPIAVGLCNGTDGINDMQYIHWKDLKTKADPDRDLLFIRFPNTVPAAKDLISKVCTENFHSARNPFRAQYHGKDKKTIYTFGTQVAKGKPVEVLDREKDGIAEAKLLYKNYYTAFDVSSKPGDCGFPYFLDLPIEKKFVGIHVAGHAAGGMFAPVYKEDCDELDPRKEDLVVQEAPLGFDLPVNPVTQSKLTPIPGVTIIGKSKRTNYMPDQTSIFPLPFYGPVADLPPVHQVNYKPAMLRAFRNDKGELIDPGLKALKKFERGIEYCGICKTEFTTEDFFPDKMVGKTFRRLTIEEAIFGCPSLGVVPLPRNTSMGWPWTWEGKKKKDLIDWDKQTIDPSLRRAVLDCYDLLKKGLVELVYLDCLKDELRPIDKVKSGSTRLFAMNSFHQLVACKMIFGPIVAAAMDSSPDVAFFGATDPATRKWEFIYRRLMKFGGKTIMAGDFHGYDASHRAFLAAAIYGVLKNFAENEEHEKQIKNYCYSKAQVYHIYKDTIYMVRGSSPSGDFLTLFFNNIINRIIHYTIFRKIYPDLRFCDNVVDYYIGDDSILSVSENCPRFNMMSVAKYAKKFFGMEYTNADKDEVSRPYVNIESATFGKRHFYKHKKLVLCPLERQSIEKIVQYTTDDTIPLNCAQRRACDVALSEWFHYGPVEYNFYMKEYNERLQRIGQPPITTTWSDHLIKYLQTYECL